MPSSPLQNRRGHVVRQPFALGSKSAHQAVCLQDTRGKSYRLRFVGGDPFCDPQVEALVGKNIKVTGEIVHGNTLLIHSWAELDPSGSAPRARKPR